MDAGKGYIDVSTVDAGTAQQVASAIREAGGQYLEAPVSGSKQPAEKGQLIFLAGGILLRAHGATYTPKCEDGLGGKPGSAVSAVQTCGYI